MLNARDCSHTPTTCFGEHSLIALSDSLLAGCDKKCAYVTCYDLPTLVGVTSLSNWCTFTESLDCVCSQRIIHKFSSQFIKYNSADYGWANYSRCTSAATSWTIQIVVYALSTTGFLKTSLEYIYFAVWHVSNIRGLAYIPCGVSI